MWKLFQQHFTIFRSRLLYLRKSTDQEIKRPPLLQQSLYIFPNMHNPPLKKCRGHVWFNWSNSCLDIVRQVNVWTALESWVMLDEIKAHKSINRHQSSVRLQNSCTLPKSPRVMTNNVMKSHIALNQRQEKCLVMLQYNRVSCWWQMKALSQQRRGKQTAVPWLRWWNKSFGKSNTN